MHRLIQVGLITFLTSCMFILGDCGSQEEIVDRDERILVKTQKVLREEISLLIHTSGKLFSTTEVKLSFKVGGIIDRILVNEGESVNAGRLLAQLKLDEINAQVNQARSGYQKAERDFQRAQDLFADSVATLEQIQDAETGFSIARSNLEIAEFNFKHSKIYAPTNGRILKRFGERNEMIAPGSPVFFFGSSGQEWILRVGISDRDILRVQLGDSASVTFDAHPGIVFPASVSEVAQAADPMSGTFEVELTIYKDQYSFASGFVASVDIIPTRKDTILTIPIEALAEADGNQGIVYVIGSLGDSARKIPITIGQVFDNKVTIRAGLEDISEVITDGSSYLTDGSPIRVSDQKP